MASIPSLEWQQRTVAALRAGDPHALTEVYQLYRARLFGYLLRMAGDRPTAEDLLQETWLRVARAAPGLREDTRIDAWLFTVARNTFISERRWRMLDATRLLKFQWFPSISPRTPLAEVELRAEQRRVEDALARLDLPHREILLLVGAEGFTPQEVSTILGLTPEATRKRLSRARAQLDEMLTSGEGQDG